MRITVLVFAAMLLGIAPRPAAAHCDGLDGPVVKAARAALDKGDLKLALAWVQPADETAVRQAFDQTVAVRKLGSGAKDLADRYFFETLVRVHRAGEGAPYTGLKAAGRDLGPAIPAADRALADGSVEKLVEELKHSVEHGVRERFEHARAASRHDASNVEAGRAFVKAYVEFLHYVEGVHEAAAPPRGHAH